MEFEWDAAKSVANARKHGVSFDQAKRAFEDLDRVILEDLKHSEGEARYVCLGKVRGNVPTVVFTYRRASVRIITCGYWRKGRVLYEQETEQG